MGPLGPKTKILRSLRRCNQMVSSSGPGFRPYQYPTPITPDILPSEETDPHDAGPCPPPVREPAYPLRYSFPPLDLALSKLHSRSEASPRSLFLRAQRLGFGQCRLSGRTHSEQWNRKRPRPSPLPIKGSWPPPSRTWTQVSSVPNFFFSSPPFPLFDFSFLRPRTWTLAILPTRRVQTI